MPTLLNVTLNTSTNPWTVNIDQSGKANHVPRSSSAQTITWQLTGNAAKGSFVSLKDAHPGFEWGDVSPPSGIFSDTKISTDGNQLTMNDLNENAGAVGEWIYLLRVNFDGTVYSSIVAKLQGTNTNPSIKNN